MNKPNKQTHLAKTLNSVLTESFVLQLAFKLWQQPNKQVLHIFKKCTRTNKDKTNSQNSTDNLYSHQVL